MPGINGYFTFLVTGILLNITPGADIFYVLSKAGTGGRRIGIASAFRICTGILIHTIFVTQKNATLKSNIIKLSKFI